MIKIIKAKFEISYTIPSAGETTTQTIGNKNYMEYYTHLWSESSIHYFLFAKNTQQNTNLMYAFSLRLCLQL